MKLAVFNKNSTNPAYVAARLGADLLRTLSSHQAAEEFRKHGIGMIGSPPAGAATFIAPETGARKRTVKAAIAQVG